MACGLGSPEQIAECIYFGKSWLQVLFDAAGLGAFTLTSVLIWFVQRLRSDMSRWEKESEHSNDKRRIAEESAATAKHFAELAERNAAQYKYDLDNCRRITTASKDAALQELGETQAQLAEKSKRFGYALKLTGGGSENFWSSAVGNRCEGYERAIASSIPIVMFGNQKGGVGKTTTVANLAAAFAARGERVLAVDLDYQGSLSTLMQLQCKEARYDSLIDYVFEDVLDGNWRELAVRKLTDNIHYIPAFYPFESVERRVEYRWALGEAEDDVRYRLARALLSVKVQKEFDRVLIDAPPRFTLGFVNGFCAATHLYVPTVVDKLATSAVEAFARQFVKLKPIVNPNIRWAGIIGTMTFVNPHERMSLPATAEVAAANAELTAQSWLGTQEELFIRNPVIKHTAPIARATEKGIAYLNDSSVRPMFDVLAEVIHSKAPRRSS